MTANQPAFAPSAFNRRRRSVSFDESPAHRLGAVGGLKITLGGSDD